jgi:hypothetical protein
MEIQFANIQNPHHRLTGSTPSKNPPYHNSISPHPAPTPPLEMKRKKSFKKNRHKFVIDIYIECKFKAKASLLPPS